MQYPFIIHSKRRCFDRKMNTSDALIQILSTGPQPARALYERLGISQPTLPRLTGQLGVSILRFGKARQTQYALRRKLGAHETFPLYRVSTSGILEQWGWLHPVMPAGYLVETSATAQNDARLEFHLGLLWFLQDMRPQGFLGCSFARFHGPMLGLPADPNRWGDDQTLLALSSTVAERALYRSKHSTTNLPDSPPTGPGSRRRWCNRED